MDIEPQASIEIRLVTFLHAGLVTCRLFQQYFLSVPFILLQLAWYYQSPYTYNNSLEFFTSPSTKKNYNRPQRHKIYKCCSHIFRYIDSISTFISYSIFIISIWLTQSYWCCMRNLCSFIVSRRSYLFLIHLCVLISFLEHLFIYSLEVPYIFSSFSRIGKIKLTLGILIFLQLVIHWPWVSHWIAGFDCNSIIYLKLTSPLCAFPNPKQKFHGSKSWWICPIR